MTSGRTGAAATRRGERLTRLARALAVLRVEGVRSFWFKVLGETVCRRVVVMEVRDAGLGGTPYRFISICCAICL